MTSKKLLSAVLALMLMMSFMTALPVSADGVTATVGGVAVADGGQISAASTVVLTVPSDVTSKDMVTFYEKSKTPTTSGGTDYPWFKRNFDGTLEGQTLTVTFERGDISSNSAYKFEFDTNSETEGAEYSFNFVTVPEVDKDGNTVYFAENFSRYTWETNADHDFKYAGWNTNSLPYNMDPIRKGRTWIGGSDSTVYSGVIADGSGNQYMKVSVSGSSDKFSQFGINPQYSGVVNSLSHLGQLTVRFKPAEIKANKTIDIAGVAINMGVDSDTGSVTWSVYGETTYKNPGSDNTFDASKHKLLATKTYASTEAALVEHTLSMITDTTLTAAGAASRNLLQLTLDDDVIWSTNAEEPFSFATTATGASGKGVPWASSLTTSVPNATNLFNVTYGGMYVYYAEYMDYQVSPLVLRNSANNYTTTGEISWTFDQDVSVSSAVDGVVLQRQTVDGTGWKDMNMDSTFLSLGADKKTLIASFEDGDLTPGMKYRVKLTTDVKSNMGGFLTAETAFAEFTAQEDSKHVIMSANFEQYQVGGTYQGDTRETVYPFGVHYGWTGNSAAKPNNYTEGLWEDATGDRYINLTSFNSPIKSWDYSNAYAKALPDDALSHRGISTVKLAISGKTGSLADTFGVGFQATGDAKGTWNIYYRSGPVSLNGKPLDNIEDYTLLGTYETGDTLFDGTEKHVVEIDSEVYIAYIEGANRAIRTLYGIIIDGNPVCVSAIGTGKVMPYSQQWGDGVMYGGALRLGHGNVPFALSRVPVSTDESTGTTTYSSDALNIFEVSYRDAIEVDAEATASALTFTVKNDTSASVSSVIPVLAVYDVNGLVRVDGLNAEATAIAAGATETFTKAITSDDSGCTYKFMLLDSAENLKPLWYATKGTIE
ncbi:MAG: hypothetical protein E7400_05245 [Ruminococcaceae bacterium]|nr:hypothetical protein [Oscillospiraceae bacterium]